MTTRRQLLTSISALAITLAVGSTALLGGRAAQAQDAQPGGEGQSGSPEEEVWIEGYPSSISINQGQAVDLHVSTNAHTFDVVLYRIGYYAGAGAQVIDVVNGLPGVRQEIPGHDPDTGLLELTWSSAYTIKTSKDWKSGVYVAKLIPDGRDNNAGYLLFVVRHDERKADILYAVATSTYQAYNNWGGKSLYDYNSDGGRAVKVSYSRPFSQGRGLGRLFQGDYQMIQWLEREGYDVAYAASEDLHLQPELAGKHPLFLSNFHDEYYSWEMRSSLERALSGGTSLAFFGANNIYWQTRYEASRITGDPARTLVCYKDATIDPVSASSSPERTSVRWRDAPVNRPENALLGTMYEGNFDDSVSFPWIVTNASHWIYEGTNLRDGDVIDQMIGHEYDRVFQNDLTPENLQTISDSPIEITKGTQNASIYEAPSRALVFNAATNRWPAKLEPSRISNPAHYVDSRIQRMTGNILNRMLGRVPLKPHSSRYVIYDEAIAFDWKDNKSPGELLSTTASFSGRHGIQLSLGEEGGRLSLNSMRSVSTDPFDYVTFAIKTTRSNRTSLQLWDDQSEPTSPAIPLRDYPPLSTTVDGWAYYRVPLRDVNPQNARIAWFWIRCSTGPESIFIDQVAFARDDGMDQSSCGIADLQRSLGERGHDTGELDGAWGGKSRSALLEFERAELAWADGTPDESSCEALGLRPKAPRPRPRGDRP